ncbi:MAG TPA: glycerol-3-phosphate 1-O-acyltransferase PlsY, partial [Fimbriiglobus sp.]|nr:glycerol-3-phosphate 1-O-acyltransferase PlsY [Fimbriiglobus sp.]
PSKSGRDGRGPGDDEMLTTALLLLTSYLIGAIPFGYLIARLKGVDLFKAGSGNIGATNVGRILGRKYGARVFVLDFLKGAGPVAAIVPVSRSMNTDAAVSDDVLRVGAALLAFLGHLFPVYLGFRGGKGVATGAGAVCVLVPGPAAVAVLTWVVVALSTRFVSLASVAALAALVAARLAGTPDPFGVSKWVVTAFCLVGSALVVVKHRGNIRRLLAGTENRIGDGPMRQTLLRGLHILALGFWFGGAGFFSFVAAPAIFDSFKQVVNDGPSDRTAHQTIIPPGATDKEKKDLASALAGSAVGPVFPKFFLMQSICGGVALITALTWFRAGSVGRWRVYLIGLALVLAVVGWPISEHVSQLRVERFRTETAQAAFVSWHLVSLLLSFVTTCLAGAGLALAAKINDPQIPQISQMKDPDFKSVESA